MFNSCIDHDEAMIETFMENPNYANELLNAVIADGDIEEIQCVQAWYDEAKKRTQAQSYWDSLTHNAKIAIQNGLDLKFILNNLNEATNSR